MNKSLKGFRICALDHSCSDLVSLPILDADYSGFPNVTTSGLEFL